MKNCWLDLNLYLREVKNCTDKEGVGSVNRCNYNMLYMFVGVCLYLCICINVAFYLLVWYIQGKMRRIVRE